MRFIKAIFCCAVIFFSSALCFAEYPPVSSFLVTNGASGAIKASLTGVNTSLESLGVDFLPECIATPGASDLCALETFAYGKIRLLIEYKNKKYYSGVFNIQHNGDYSCPCQEGQICDCYFQDKYKLYFDGKKVMTKNIELYSREKKQEQQQTSRWEKFIKAILTLFG